MLAVRVHDCCEVCNVERGVSTVTTFNYNDYTVLQGISQRDLTYAVITSLGNLGRITEGGTYSFIVRARNQYGWGPYSDYATVVALTAPSAP